MGVERDGFGGEVITGFGAHFVKVGDDDGVPFLEHLYAGLCLRLRDGEPVAIHVEEVVIEAASGPGFIAFGG